MLQLAELRSLYGMGKSLDNPVIWVLKPLAGSEKNQVKSACFLDYLSQAPK